jgi:hypothetical protein
VLRLNTPVIAYGLFGIERQVSQTGITFDDEALFQRELNKRWYD